MQYLLIKKSSNDDLPKALQKAIGKYSLTEYQAENLAYAIKKAGMRPSDALANLKIMSPETLAHCLMARSEWGGIVPSIKLLAKAMERTGFPIENDAPDDLEYRALYHEIQTIIFKKKWKKTKIDYSTGKYDRKENQITLSQYVIRPPWGEDDYDRQWEVDYELD